MVTMKLNMKLKVEQRHILGLMQMARVLALNKLELKEIIYAEVVSNPVLEGIDESVSMLDQVAGREELLERGYRAQPEYEDIERPSFENFLSQPTTLTDHMEWQLGALSLDPLLRQVAEFIVGNLEEDGYLAATDEELTAAFSQQSQNGFAPGPSNGAANASAPYPEILDLIRRGIDLVQQLDPAGVGARDLRECLLLQIAAQQHEFGHLYSRRSGDNGESLHRGFQAEADNRIEVRRRAMESAALIVDSHLSLLQKRDFKALARAAHISVEMTHAAAEFIRTLDPLPGRMYNREQTRLIEPDVVFTKRGGEWAVAMNEEDMPSLRLSQFCRRLLASQSTNKEVKEYVKEHFRSALQLMRNIAQRKSTILRTCEIIVCRQQEFLESGIEALRPMMIKDVAEEIGVHSSTVSRAVSNKYALTPQGVIELRFFFSASASGPEGTDTSLLVLKRKIRKFIEEEDPQKPLTDDQLAAMLQAQGIDRTRRTVAQYREQMNIPSAHQRRRRDKFQLLMKS